MVWGRSKSIIEPLKKITLSSCFGERRKIPKYFLRIVSDKVVLTLIQIILIGFLAVSIWHDCRHYTRETSKKANPGVGISTPAETGTSVSLSAKAEMPASAEVVRGERSINAIYTMYAIATLAITLAVQVAETAKGYKSGIIIMDYAFLTYLFFFNSWLRNWLLTLFVRIVTF